MKDEDRARKATWKASQVAQRDAALPAPWTELRSLAAELNARLIAAQCDHSLRFTTEWIARQKLSTTTFFSWARERGGYCDCEILMNTLDEDQL